MSFDWFPGQIGSLQATQMSHEATIRNLDLEQNRLKEKISRLEEEREGLLNQSQTSNEQHRQQVLKLEQVIFNPFIDPSPILTGNTSRES